MRAGDRTDAGQQGRKRVGSWQQGVEQGGIHPNCFGRNLLNFKLLSFYTRGRSSVSATLGLCGFSTTTPHFGYQTVFEWTVLRHCKCMILQPFTLPAGHAPARAGKRSFVMGTDDAVG